MSSNIEHIEENAFSNLTSLERLNLNGNRLMTLSYSHFRDLHQLQILLLHNNFYLSLETCALKSNPNLKILVIVNTTVNFNLRLFVDGSCRDGIIPAQLTHLNIINTPTEKITLQILSEFTLLERLSFGNDAGTEIDDGVLALLDHLTYLTIINLPFVYNCQNDVSTLVYLDTLAVNQLDYFPQSFIKHDNLTSMSISGSSFSALPPNAFVNNPSLTSLDIESPLEVVDKDSFTGLTELQYLSLYSNKLTTLPEGLLMHTPNVIRVTFDPPTLYCNCDLQWLINFLNRETKPQLIGQCNSPPELSQVDLSALNSTYLFNCTNMNQTISTVSSMTLSPSCPGSTTESTSKMETLSWLNQKETTVSTRTSNETTAELPWMYVVVSFSVGIMITVIVGVLILCLWHHLATKTGTDTAPQRDVQDSTVTGIDDGEYQAVDQEAQNQFEMTRTSEMGTNSYDRHIFNTNSSMTVGSSVYSNTIYAD